MKTKIFALSLLAAACMTSCSDSSIDTEVISPEQQQGELKTYSFKTAIILPQEMAGSLTRAEGDGNKDHTDGDDKEYNVDQNKIYFSLYNADGIAMNRATLETSPIKWETDTENDLVTMGTVVSLKSLQKPKYLVVFVNLGDKERTNLVGQNLENLLDGKENDGTYFRPGRNYLSAALGNNGQTFYQRPASFRNMMLERYANLKDNGSFFMMNSSWNSDSKKDNNGSKNIRAVDITDYIYEGEIPDNNAREALVYVERVVAKVNTSFKFSSEPTTGVVKAGGEDYAPIVKIDQKHGYNSGTSTVSNKKYAKESYYVKFDGWQLNATNKSFKPLKDIGETPSHFLDVAGNDYMAYRTGRSYWAIDQNHNYVANNFLTNGDFTIENGWAYTKTPLLNYYTLTNMKRLKFGKYTGLNETDYTSNSSNISEYTDYCFENTMDGTSQAFTGAVTHVLVRAQYVTDANGTKIDKNKNIYRVGKTIYEQEGLIDYIYDHLKAMYPTKMTGIDQIKLYHNNQDFYNHNDVKSKVLVSDLKGTKYTNVSGVETEIAEDGDVTQLVFGEATIYTYERGVCYYSIPIKHFASNHKVGEEGFYGVVRNHWYQVEITKVDAFGHPATPGVGPYPEDPDKPYDPENPGKENPDYPGHNNPNDPDNPGKPNDPTKPGYTDPDPSNPHDPKDPGTNPGNPGKPIIPEDSEDDDFNLNARIKVLSWAKMHMTAQLGGMQTWN